MIRSALLTLLLVTPAAAQEITSVPLAGMELNPTPFDGVAAAFVTGAFDAEGLYAANSVLSDGAFFPPHAHPDDRLTLVLEGTMHLGTGTSETETDETAYPAGTAVLTPAGTMHWMAARSGDVRVLEIGAGPSGTTFAE